MDCMKESFNDGQILDGRFEALSPLNHGSFGMVFMARDMTTQDLVAIKCLTKRSATDESSWGFAVDEKSEELECHARLGLHSNIVNLIHHFETDAHVYLVLEFCSRGDLYEAIRTGCGPLETEHVREFMLQLIDAVSYIHSRGMYHRDIKPENIFLTQDGTLKLGDFGLATKDEWSYETAVGSDRYMAPEQQDSAGAGYSTAQADIWAIGICLLNILFSRNPFTKPTEADPLFLDFTRDRQSLFDVFPNMSQDTFEVVVQCMSLDPSKRSLIGARDAIVRAISFTTFDDLNDDFCASSDVKPPCATLNREPLRTPSISTPMNESGAFPWAKALHASPPMVTRQLSIIHDTENYDEDLFPSSEESHKDWFSVGNQTPSVSSIFNYSLAESMKSMAIRRPSKKSGPPRATLSPISGSLPVSATKPKDIPSFSSMFSKHDTTSKSWGDLWDEDMEEEEEEQHEKDLKVRQALNSRTWSHESVPEQVETAPRNALACKTPSFINMQSTLAGGSKLKVEDLEEDVIEEGLFSFETSSARKTASPPRYSPPSKRSPVDKWSALGDRRRGLSGSSEKSPMEVWGRGRRGTNTSSNHASNYQFGSTSANVAGGAISSSFSYVPGLGVSFGKEKVHGASLNHKNNFSSNFGMAGQPRFKDTSRGCPWTGARDKLTSLKKERVDLGDLEWVGGWQDDDLGLQL